MTAWLLPENVEDVLPPQAWRMEDMRRALLDLFRGQGFQLGGFKPNGQFGVRGGHDGHHKFLLWFLVQISAFF